MPPPDRLLEGLTARLFSVTAAVVEMGGMPQPTIIVFPEMDPRGFDRSTVCVTLFDDFHGVSIVEAAQLAILAGCAEAVLIGAPGYQVGAVPGILAKPRPVYTVTAIRLAGITTITTRPIIPDGRGAALLGEPTEIDSMRQGLADFPSLWPSGAVTSADVAQAQHRCRLMMRDELFAYRASDDLGVN